MDLKIKFFFVDFIWNLLEDDKVNDIFVIDFVGKLVIVDVMIIVLGRL